MLYTYRFVWPRAIFFTLRLADPRGTVRFPSGFSAFFFLRDARFAFLRSSLLSLLVSAMSSVFSFSMIWRRLQTAVSFAPLGLCI